MASFSTIGSSVTEGRVTVGTIRIRLVEDWRRAWRWSSVRLIAISAALQGALLAFPLKDYVPGWIIQTVATGTLFVTLAAAAGRVTTAEPKDGHLNDH